ncbi:MAG: hypothetical protein Q9160_008787 [Pyrenula sp. 1 TL-2023]
MSKSQSLTKDHQHITSPQSFVTPPLTSPSTDEKVFTQVSRAVALFKDQEAGRNIDGCSWEEIQLAQGDYREVERQVGRDEDLLAFVNNKIRYNYFGESHRLAVRIPNLLHEHFIEDIADEIRSQLKQIRCGSDSAATFAQNIHSSGLATIRLPGSESEHSPDASFQHNDAEYPGVIVEVGYSQKRKSLARLAEDYLLDSDTSLDIEYGKDKGALHKATLSVWRTRQVPVADGQEFRVFQEIAEKAFWDDQGNPTDDQGLRLQLVDFGPPSLTQGVGDREMSISTGQLCQYLAAAERQMQGQGSSVKRHLPPGAKKRKRSETPAEEIIFNDEAWYAEHEERDAKRAEVDDYDYEDTGTTGPSSRTLMRKMAAEFGDFVAGTPLNRPTQITPSPPWTAPHNLPSTPAESPPPSTGTSISISSNPPALHPLPPQTSREPSWKTIPNPTGVSAAASPPMYDEDEDEPMSPAMGEAIDQLKIYTLGQAPPSFSDNFDQGHSALFERRASANGQRPQGGAVLSGSRLMMRFKPDYEECVRRVPGIMRIW